MDENPTWPRITTLRKNVEERMSLSRPAAEIADWFHRRPPLTARGQALFIRWMLDHGQQHEAENQIKDVWINGDFTRRDEKWFYRTYRKYLTKGDHEKRLERLLWEGGNWSVRRMFTRVNSDLRKLAEARYLLRHMRGNVDSAIERVPEKYKTDIGLIYERLRWRTRKGKSNSARSLLDEPLGPVPHPHLWYKERELLARRALSKGLVSAAYDLVRHHGVDPQDAGPFSSAEWMSGWIALRFLREPEWALRHFSDMYDVVSFPISVARAAYWAGRSAVDMGDTASSAIWFKRAADFPTTYYGQLARSHLGRNDPILLPAPSNPENPAGEVFDNHELIKVIKLLEQLGEQERMRPFFVHLRDSRPGDRAWLAATGKLALSVGRHDMAVYVGKAALRHGILLPELGYPVIDLPDRPQKAVGPAAEDALVYALIRQESAFYVPAYSSAGARGLMQMMPATAKLTARSLSMRYERKRLTTDPEYNLKLGQSYLSEVLERFDGSYVLGLAAYNAGPNRAKAWIKAHGDPRDREVDVIDWIELIPFYETRNYVQRVMESVLVYRARTNATASARTILDDLHR